MPQETFRRFCAVCRNVSLLPYDEGPQGRPNAVCPVCGSLERHRFLAVLTTLASVFVARPRLVLDLAPAGPSAQAIASLAPETYVRVDLGIGHRAADVTAGFDSLPASDASVSVVVAGHALRAAPDIDVSLADISRVLSPSGFALLGGLHTLDVGDWPEVFERHGLVGTPVTPISLIGSQLSNWFHLAPTEPVWIVRSGRGADRAADVPSALSEGADAMFGRPPLGRSRMAEGEAADDGDRMGRHEFLCGVHQRLAPRTYFEIGVDTGASLSLARCRAIGVDPSFRVSAPLSGDITLVRSTSDDFFGQSGPLERFGETPVDLAFIDGMHHAEFAYRDFLHTERYCGPASVVVFDDVLPRSSIEAARLRQTKQWAGDVFKTVDVIRSLRPDLAIVLVDTAPTGTALALCLDPASTVLADHYDDVLDQLVAPDPQDVPDRILSRTGAVDPRALLDSPLWDLLRDRRESGHVGDLGPLVHAELEELRARSDR
jgi:hypothetical protein